MATFAWARSTASSSSDVPKKEFPLLSRDAIEDMIAQGRKIVIVDQQVLKVDPFVQYHPGGEIAIEHMVGRDATDEVTVLHSTGAKQQMLRYRIGRIEGRWHNFIPPIQGGKFRTIDEIRKQAEEEAVAGDMSKDASASSDSSRAPSPVFDVDSVEESTLRRRGGGASAARSSSVSSESSVEQDGLTFLDGITQQKISLDLENYPALDEETQDHIVEKYRALYERIEDAGLFKCNYWAYGIECSRYATLFVLNLVCLSYGQYALAGFFLGAMWQQLSLAAHDAGHMGITHDFQTDSVIAIIIADFIGGLSMGWWKRNHNVHHIVTNAPEHDPDIEHMPLFAVSHRLLGNLKSTFYNRVMEYDAAAKVLLRIQPYTYYPFLAFGRFNLIFLSLDHLINGRGPRKGEAAWFRWLELAGQVFFWTWFGYGLVYGWCPNNWARFTYVMVSNMASSPLHLQIVLSHFAMSTADLGPNESFAQKMLRTTMDVDCPEWLDFFHGGLQFQAIHHLYPRMPRHNLRKAQRLVQEFCNDAGIPYALYGFAESNRHVIGRLSEVSRQAAILGKCQRVVTQSDDFLMH